MMRRIVNAFFAWCMTLLVVVPMWPAQSDPMIGTWTLNLSLSTFVPGPPPQRDSVTYRKTAKGYAWLAEIIDAQGQPKKVEGTLVFDGLFHSVAGSPDWDEIAFKGIDIFTTEVTRRKAGKIVQTARRVLSRDYMTLTITTEGVNANGRRISQVAVYEKNHQ